MHDSDAGIYEIQRDWGKSVNGQSVQTIPSYVSLEAPTAYHLSFCIACLPSGGNKELMLMSNEQQRAN